MLRLGGDSFAIPLSLVWEVVAGPEIAPIPTVGSPVVGLFNLRGELVPVFDPAAVLGVGGARHEPHGAEFVVVVDAGDTRAGLVAGVLPSVSRLGHALAATDPHSGRALHTAGTTIVTLLDPAELLTGAARGSASPPALASGWVEEP